jgi:copper chaperone
MMKSEIRVSGMSCGGCQLLVKEALEELNGVTAAEASFRDSLVVVEYDPEMVPLTTITTVIEEQGFKVQQ